MRKPGLKYLWFLLLTPAAFAAPGKYPDCIKGKPVKAKDKFHLEFAFQDSVNGDMAVVIYQMGANSLLRPEFPRLISTGMNISFEAIVNSNVPKVADDPKELDRLARQQLEATSKLKNVTIFCD